MCEVTEKNFEEIYPQVMKDLHSATFISIDCEFSGLFDDDCKNSLFDSPKARFQKLQYCLDTVNIIQFGLSTFEFKATQNQFLVASYSFYLKPAPVLKKQKFTFQLGSLEFLCKNDFNFNKLFYDGVFYLNKSHKKMVLSMIENGSLKGFAADENIQKYCSRVAEWNVSASEDSEMLLELTDENKMFLYVLHGEIRKRFPNVWTYFAENNVIRIKKLKHSDKSALSMAEEEIFLQKKLLDCILGFTKIIEELEKLQKPIVGHNLLMDLILIYKQFFNPLPVSYKNFKSAIRNIFPIIYDTKLLSFRLRDILKKESTWNSNCLSILYSYLKDGKGSTLVIYTPIINHKNKGFVEEISFHEAGFDSYCTGFCFIKMAHIFSLWDKKKKSFLLTSFNTSTKWLLGAVSNMKNQVNLTRSQVKYINLDNDDPKSVPNLIYIYSKTKKNPLDLSEISRILAKYSSVDIQLISQYSGLLAVGNRHQAQEIQGCFKNHKDYRVTKYNFFKHSTSGRCIVSGTVVLSVIFIIYFTSNKWRL